MLLLILWCSKGSVVQEEGWEELTRNCGCPVCDIRRSRGTVCIRDVPEGLGLSSLESRRACSCPWCWTWAGGSEEGKADDAINLVMALLNWGRLARHSHGEVVGWETLLDASLWRAARLELDQGNLYEASGGDMGNQGSKDGEQAFRMEVPGCSGQLGTGGVRDKGKAIRPSEWKSDNAQGNNWEEETPANRPSKWKCQNAPGSSRERETWAEGEARRPSEWKGHNAQGR